MQAKATIEAEAEQSARMLTLTQTPSTFGLHKLPLSLEEWSSRSASFALFHQSTCTMSKAISSANAKSDHYRHHPLSLTRDQFRLIKISPGRLNEGILCQVRHFDRAGKDAYGSYTALSYTWGEVEAVGPIYMQTVGANENNFPAPFTVTQNLADILRHIIVARETDPGDARWKGWWWIDALCIIQTENDPEKDRQIKLMPATYSEAGEVYAWIGRGTERTNTAIDFMDRRSRDAELAELSSASIYRWNQFPDLPSCIGEVFARPYWRRLWIIQELSMSSKKTTIACGHFETSLQALYDYAEDVDSMDPEELASEPLQIAREQTRRSVTQTVSALSTPVTDTSSLSELSETPSSEVGSVSFGGSGVADVDEDSAGEYRSDNNNTYDDQREAERTLKHTKIACAKDRLGGTISDNVYACPRCKSHMSKKYSTERHIKDSCWKVCDECCESNNATCDAFYVQDACKHCVKQGLKCTKHTEPMSDCVPELLTGVHPRPYKSTPRATRAGTTSKRDRGKRKATQSPSASPNSKPFVKRSAAVADREERRAIVEPDDNAVRPDPLDKPQFTADEKARERKRAEDNVPVTGDHVQNYQDLRYYVPIAPPSRQTIMPQRRQQGQRLSQSSLPSRMLRLTPGQQHDGRDVVTVDEALRRWPQTHNSAGRMFYIVDGNGEVLSQSMIEGNELLQNVRRQQARIEVWAARYDDAFRVNQVPPPVDPVFPPQNARRTSFNEAHPPVSRLNRFRPVQSANFEMYEDAARRKLQSKDFVASAPGSRMPSRQSSPQPSPHLGAPARLPSSEQPRGINLVPHTTKGYVGREITQPISLQLSTRMIADENDPVLRLRIHSNTYDINNTPIFSILTIRASRNFGPHLDAYCRQRNKQYGVDWAFIYRYALGGPWDVQRERYIKIDYDMTPNDVQDTERPEIKLRDMDTLMVMKAKSPTAVMVESSHDGIEIPQSPIGSQVSEEQVDIINGETSVYQNAGTIANWHRLVDTKMVELRGEIVGLSQENQLQKTVIAQQTEMLHDLVKRNNDLIQGNYGRVACRVGHVLPSTAQYTDSLGTASQRGPVVQHSPFLDRLEAVRQPTEHIALKKPNQQYRFPTSAHGMQGRYPMYHSGAPKTSPDLQQSGVPKMHPAQFAVHGSTPLLQGPNGGDDGWNMDKAA
ncbi:hypothetical protein GT037_004703 [Alternaria burnsii]|uniref:Heterokaryon incompatibility domain-containing protein n=1 Tax=Alternaria burnsii TaxID=1187904 RepID=A0A8H7EJB9_9PLEO|nr:uncharacterized protein GT037_004703 [Alternaria burnsii]KAF7677844.1 hypothetical protein GT037_004703 [Alternaria burnsii]